MQDPRRDAAGLVLDVHRYLHEQRDLLTDPCAQMLDGALLIKAEGSSSSRIPNSVPIRSSRSPHEPDRCAEWMSPHAGHDDDIETSRKLLADFAIQQARTTAPGMKPGNQGRKLGDQKRQSPNPIRGAQRKIEQHDDDPPPLCRSAWG